MYIMTTKIKAGFTEQSKAVTCSIVIESDELSFEEVKQKLESSYNELAKFSGLMTMNKIRGARQ